MYKTRLDINLLWLLDVLKDSFSVTITIYTTARHKMEYAVGSGQMEQFGLQLIGDVHSYFVINSVAHTSSTSGIVYLTKVPTTPFYF